MVATLMDSPEDKAETEEEDISGLLELEACAAKRFWRRASSCKKSEKNSVICSSSFILNNLKRKNTFEWL